ncbi:peptidase inhibitor family I36 protein [Nostoc sp.]|uniref:peptidase inhibitor family I36 protein n=1 Tax=Nostoc sp. TaxID=1180 RepID=UPI002FFD26F5
MTTNNLYAIDTVQDLNEKSAATVQGGILVYTGPNFGGSRRDVQATRNLGSVGLNNVISSIRNNTRKTWVFYTGINNSGRSFSLRAGQSVSRLGNFDNQISSLRSIG